MYQLCKHGKQDGEPCLECAKIVSQNSLQHTQAKMPTLDECHKEVQSRIWASGFVGTSINITEVVYNFICRHIGCV